MRFEHAPVGILRGMVLAVALVLTCTSCAHTPPAATPVVVSPPQPTREDAAIMLLDYAGALARGTPEQREQAVAAARAAVDDSPGALHYARLALAYGAPAQRRYTPDEVARYTQLALQAKDARWSPAARQYLQDYGRLYAALEQHRTAPANPTPRPVEPVRAQDTDREQHKNKRRIAELQAQLADARRKLRELANIEGNLSADIP